MIFTAGGGENLGCDNDGRRRRWALDAPAKDLFVFFFNSGVSSQGVVCISSVLIKSNPLLKKKPFSKRRCRLVFLDSFRINFGCFLGRFSLSWLKKTQESDQSCHESARE